MNFQNYSMANAAFDRFGVGTFSMELFLSHSFRWLISLPGLLFNAALLNTIIREKSVHGTCATLLAIGSAVDFVFLLSFSVPFAISLVGQNMISNFDCFFLQFVPNFGLFSSVSVVFFVGIDRLISVLFPLWYCLLERHFFIYIFPMLTVTFGYSIYVLIEAAQLVLFVYKDWAVLCNNGDMFSFGMSAMVLRNGLVINDPNAMARHRIFKSLAAIMALLVGTYFSICFIRLLLRSVKDPFFNFHILSSVTALFTVTAASSNGLILFIFSSEYQLAFRKHLKGWPLIGLCLSRMGQQVPVNVIVVTNFNIAANQPRTVSRQFGQTTTKREGAKGKGTKAMALARVDA
ncbi:hypothetical protein niasHS_000889 [Heterodera schachtii]|uniref:G-protein coupled receptors family 1 profile domain-containing protein n=1 Tax=Heterodera schachtii TaxID=97005 RepID=A0ABD2KI04_HETSC